MGYGVMLQTFFFTEVVLTDPASLPNHGQYNYYLILFLWLKLSRKPRLSRSLFMALRGRVFSTRPPKTRHCSPVEEFPEVNKLD